MRAIVRATALTSMVIICSGTQATASPEEVMKAAWRHVLTHDFDYVGAKAPFREIRLPAEPKASPIDRSRKDGVVALPESPRPAVDSEWPRAATAAIHIAAMFLDAAF